METQVNYQDVVEVLKDLPPARVAEVYDFARFLRSQRLAVADSGVDRAAFLATFGIWKDDRSDQDIIADIYAARTTSMEERSW